MRRQHLGMGVDIDTLPLRLLEQLLENLEAVPRHDDGAPLHDARLDLGRLRFSVGLEEGPLQQPHCLEDRLTAL